MNATVLMLKHKKTGAIHYALKFNGCSTIFVFEQTFTGKDACLIEYYQVELDEHYESLLFKNDLDIAAHMNRAFRKFNNEENNGSTARIIN